MREVGCDMKRPRKTRGFTLLEVIITLSVLSLLMLTAWGAFEVGFRTREKGEGAAEEAARIRAATEVMGRQLRSAVYYFARDEEEYAPFFVGSGSEVSFITAYPQGSAGTGLAWVTYRVEDDKLVMYERTGFRPDELYSVEESENSVLSSVLLEGFGRLTFGYVPREEEGEEWEEVWDAREEDSLPSLVRITVEGLDFFGDLTWVEEVPLLTIAAGWGMDDFEEPPEIEEQGESAGATPRIQPEADDLDEDFDVE